MDLRFARFQRKGIGKKLFNMLSEWFFKNKARRICIDAPRENEYRQFYLKHGAKSLFGPWLVWDDISKAVIYSLKK